MRNELAWNRAPLMAAIPKMAPKWPLFETTELSAIRIRLQIVRREFRLWNSRSGWNHFGKSVVERKKIKMKMKMKMIFFSMSSCPFDWLRFFIWKGRRMAWVIFMHLELMFVFLRIKFSINYWHLIMGMLLEFSYLKVKVVFLFYMLSFLTAELPLECVATLRKRVSVRSRAI